MTISNIVEYCSAAEELAGHCNNLGGFLVGLKYILDALEEHIFLYLAIVVIGIILYLVFSKLLQVTN